ncbi:MAG: 6-bladed beta-propeller [Odoribacter splanchnicus]|nr:6-bladed beta-propeller [Odoribacter splanchnicus]
MKKCLLLLFVITVYVLLWRCTDQESAVRVEKHNGEYLYVCDYFKLNDDTLSLKLSDLIKSIEVIKLDTASNAMIGSTGVVCSDHYLLLRPNWQDVFKLFDRKGNYLCDVGGYGRGPGEYMRVHDVQLDEANGRIYILPFQTRQLLMYNLQGEHIKSIPLAGFLPMGKLKAEGDKISLLTLPFVKHARDSVTLIAFQQDLDGNLLDSVSALPYAIKTEYADWINFNRKSPSFHIYQWDGVQDSLYHYVPGKNRLIPKFTVDYKGVKSIPLHEYHEFGDYFWFTTYKLVQREDGQYTNRRDRRILVNKKNLKAGLLKIENDLLGGELMGWNFSNGYYTENLSPVALRDRLEKFSKEKGLSKETRKRVDNLLATIQEDDNNYVIIGEMK